MTKDEWKKEYNKIYNQYQKDLFNISYEFIVENNKIMIGDIVEIVGGDTYKILELLPEFKIIEKFPTPIYRAKKQNNLMLLNREIEKKINGSGITGGWMKS